MNAEPARIEMEQMMQILRDHNWKEQDVGQWQCPSHRKSRRRNLCASIDICRNDDGEQYALITLSCDARNWVNPHNGGYAYAKTATELKEMLEICTL